MAHGLFPLQFSRFSFALGGFCQTAEKVAVSILSTVFFCRFLVFPVLWGAPSGTTAEKVAISMISHCRKASFLPVVPHKAVAEVSKIGNL